jgi:hypothetical protein
MAYGTVPQRKIQIGQEGTAGQPVAATKIWRGPAVQIDAGLSVIRPSENVGLLVDTDRSYIPSKLATLDFPETEATFENVLYPLNAGVKSVLTGVADGTTGTGKIYDFPVSETGGNAVKTFTLEAGDNNSVSEMEYSFCSEFTLTWAAKETLKISSKWLGRQRTVSAFTSLTFATAAAAEEEILAPKIFVDDSTIGGGQIQGSLIGYQVTYTTGIIPLFTADGTPMFYGIKYTKPTLNLKMTYEHDANATAEYAKFVAQTTRRIRIQHQGSALTIGNGAYAYKTLLLDLAGRYTSFPPYGDSDGDNVITCEVQAGYVSAAVALYARFCAVNLLVAVL